VLTSVAAQGGSTESTLLTISALAAAAVGTNSSAAVANATTLAWQQQTQTTLLNVLVSSTNTSQLVSPRTAALQVATLLAVVQSAQNSDQSVSFLSEAGALTNALIDEARQVCAFCFRNAKAVGTHTVNLFLQLCMQSVNSLVLGSNDPQAQSLVPNTIGPQSISSLESVLQALQASLGPLSRRALLDASDPGSARSSINSLVELVMTGAVAGSPQVNIQGVLLQLAVLRQSAYAVGQDTGIQYLDLPSFNTSVRFL